MYVTNEIEFVVYVSPETVILETSTSLLAPGFLTKPVPVTVNIVPLPLKVAEVMVGTTTSDTLIGLLVASAVSPAVTLVIKSSPAAML